MYVLISPVIFWILIYPFLWFFPIAGTRQCILDNGFMSYNGQHTHPGECLHWTDDVVQSVGFELWQFAGAHSWEEMKDYCRNPDNDTTIWCYDKRKYQQDGSLKRLYCNVTECCKWGPEWCTGMIKGVSLLVVLGSRKVLWACTEECAMPE